jgi:UDP-2-acetamido-2,6-beta-L-arabino-hexul-4-ose reductase
VTRGNHYHHTKVEKFLVLKGRGEIALRRIGDDEVHTVSVSGDELRVVDIPTGYTHCIRNAGDEDMVTLFWSSEVFDPGRADTVFEEVERA